MDRNSRVVRDRRHGSGPLLVDLLQTLCAPWNLSCQLQLCVFDVGPHLHPVRDGKEAGRRDHRCQQEQQDHQGGILAIGRRLAVARTAADHEVADRPGCQRQNERGDDHSGIAAESEHCTTDGQKYRHEDGQPKVSTSLPWIGPEPVCMPGEEAQSKQRRQHEHVHAQRGQRKHQPFDVQGPPRFVARERDHGPRSSRTEAHHVGTVASARVQQVEVLVNVCRHGGPQPPILVGSSNRFS